VTTVVLSLHGTPVSNYFNIVRAALLEKNLPHTVVRTGASQDEEFLIKSPLGKIPLLGSPDGWISETVAIIEYLDDRFPEQPLRPVDAGSRARVRQIINLTQMYIEAPTRSLFAGVFAAGKLDPGRVAEVGAILDRATAALTRLASPSAFLVGDALTVADLFVFYNLDIAERVGEFVFGRSIIADAGLLEWSQHIAERESSKVILADFESAFVAYLNDHRAPYRANISPETGKLSYA
jgi:glutathione S-transferase